MNEVTINKIIQCFKMTGEISQLKLIDKIAKSHPEKVNMLYEIWNTSDSIEVKRWVVEALGKFDNVKTRKILRKALRDKAMTIRLHAIRAIESIGDKKFGQELKKLINDESGGIRMNFLDTAFKLQITGLSKIITLYLEDDKEYVKKRALHYYNYINKNTMSTNRPTRRCTGAGKASIRRINQ